MNAGKIIVVAVICLMSGISFMEPVAGGETGITSSGNTGVSTRTNGEKKETFNFITLHRLYLKWSDGLFGSRKYYRYKLKQYLLSLLDSRIKTGYNYYLESPEPLYAPRVRVVFYNGNWLHIGGRIGKKSVKEITGGNTRMLMHWWRTRTLVSVSGRIHRYRIDDWDKKIFLVLKDMKIHTRRSVPDSKGNDNSKDNGSQ